MALAESQCYTIINTPELSDVYNEMKLKKDLGMRKNTTRSLISKMCNTNIHFFQN